MVDWHYYLTMRKTCAEMSVVNRESSKQKKMTAQSAADNGQPPKQKPPALSSRRSFHVNRTESNPARVSYTHTLLRVLEEREGRRRAGIGLRQNCLGCLCQNLISRQIRRLLGKVGIGDAAFSSRHVLIRHGE